MSWLLAVFFCIDNAPILTNQREHQKACVESYYRCVNSPGRKDKSCELEVRDFYRKKS